MRKKPHKVSAWLTHDVFSHIGKVMKLRHLSRPTDAIEYILTHEDTTPQEFLVYRHCQHREAYPQDSNFCRCYKDADKGRIIEQDVCQACSLHKVIEIPLKTKQRLQQEVSDLQNRKEELKAEIKNMEEPQSQNDKLKRDLKDRDRKIEDLQKQLKIEGEKSTALLKEKTEEIATLQTDNEQLREQSQFSKNIEIEPKGEHRDKTIEEPQHIVRTAVEETKKTTYQEEIVPRAVIVGKVSCPYYAKAANRPEITKEECIGIQKYRPDLCRSVQCSEFLLKPQA
jgi:predicted RNase H-like nuclease (RuvC/YqgF family)